MKNICRLPYLANITAVFFLLSFTSCEGVLDDVLKEEPKSLDEELFYNTAEEVETAANAIYWRGGNFADYIAVLDSHSDWGYGRGSRAALNDFQGLNATWLTQTAGYWSSMYLSIRNANLVIQNAPEGSSISQEDIDKYVAEAKFLRAFSYFHLVRNWGGVPLRTEHNMTERDLARSPVNEVYSLIIADLEEAELSLPEEQSQVGRPTKFAAKTMLADVYLHLERFSEARDKAEEVMQSNRYSLVPVQTVGGFENIFGAEVTNTPEEIFYTKYAREPGQGNFMLWILNHPSTGLYNFGGAYAHYSDAADPFYQNWDDGDLRKGLWDQIDFGLGSTTIVSRKYTDQSAVDGNNAGNDLPVYRYAELLLIYAEAAGRTAGGPTAEAMEALNQVHRRAYGQDPTTASAVDFDMQDYDAEGFVDLILWERAYEFIFEGKRWHDLKRTGKARERILENRGIDIADRHFLWPIPNTEFNYNNAIDPASDQNPGY